MISSQANHESEASWWPHTAEQAPSPYAAWRQNLSQPISIPHSDPVVHVSAAANVAAAYNQAGGDYVAYADGDPTHLFAFNGLHAYADRRIWTVLEAKLTHLVLPAPVARGLRKVADLSEGAGRREHGRNRARQSRRSHGQDPRAGEPGRRQPRHRRRRRENLPRPICHARFRKKSLAGCRAKRAREAAEYRAKGSEIARTITATADRDVVVLRGNAQRQADQSRDEGDAERNRIFAEGYGRTRISLPSIARCNPMKLD